MNRTYETKVYSLTLVILPIMRPKLKSKDLGSRLYAGCTTDT